MTKLHRRRFLSIAAATTLAGLSPAAARRANQTVRWQGRVFGADAAITLRFDDAVRAKTVLAEITGLVEGFEQTFSLYRPNSSLSQLNIQGFIGGWQAGQLFDALIDVRHWHRATQGLFDPTVHAIWQAYNAQPGADEHEILQSIRPVIGFDRVHLRGDGGAIELAKPAMGLSLNSYVQGLATDQIQRFLAAQGFDQVLVNCGEYSAGAGPWRIGIADPLAGLIGQRTISHAAIATSSPFATTLGHQARSHIINPQDLAMQPLWSTVSVEAATALQADIWSTALCFLSQDEIRARAGTAYERVTLIDFAGNLRTIQA